MTAMQALIETLLEAAPEVSLEDNTRGKAIQAQIILVGKEVAGALTHSQVEGVYRLLSVGEAPDGERRKNVPVLVEIFVVPEAIQSVCRIMPRPMVEAPVLKLQ